MASATDRRLRVLCVSPAHPPHDPRVLKTIRALSQQHNVRALLPWQIDASVGVLPFFERVAVRALLVHPLVLWHVLRQRPEVLHVFMPELLPVGLLFRLLGGRVVYEVQENLRLKFDRKPRNKARWLRWLFEHFDQLARRWCYCIFTEDSYLGEYDTLALPYAVVRNFPEVAVLPEMSAGRPRSFPKHDISSTSPQATDLCYLGLITLDRGLDTMLAVVNELRKQYPTVRLHLFGRCLLSETELQALPHFAEVRSHLFFYGQVKHETAFPIMARCVAGLALLKPVGDYPGSYPTKVFEYMALGIPAITSNFPLYQSVVETNACGFCVNSIDVSLVVEHINWLFERPQEVNRLGVNGKRAVERLYNWTEEAKKLLKLYQYIDF